jgi:site-specific DNA recombinase
MGRRARTKTVASIAEHGVRVAIHVRRSTDEEHQPFYIEAQDSRLHSYVQSQPGWSLVARFEDDASGANSTDLACRKPSPPRHAGRYEVLLLYRVDRFTRRIRDLVTLLTNSTAPGSPSAPQPSLNTSTPAGRMLVQMLASKRDDHRQGHQRHGAQGIQGPMDRRRRTVRLHPQQLSTALWPSTTRSPSSS